ncbi:hypothetical protein ACOME3_005683 [Neoechinorhynchus agilis]
MKSAKDQGFLRELRTQFENVSVGLRALKHNSLSSVVCDSLISKAFDSINIAVLNELKSSSTNSVLNIMFNKHDLILDISKQMSIQPFRNGKKSLLQLLRTLIELSNLDQIVALTDQMINYFSTIFTIEKQSDTKCSLLMCLGELMKKIAVQQPSTPLIEKLVGQVLLDCSKPTTSSGLKANRLRFLGDMCRFYPQFTLRQQKRIVSLTLHYLKAEMNSKTKKPDLNVMAEEEDVRQVICNSVRYSLKMDIDYSRLLLPKSALNIIAEHSDSLIDILFDDYRIYYERLLYWCSKNNRELQNIGMRAMESFLSSLSDSLCRNHSRYGDACYEMFAFLVEQSKIRMDKCDKSKIDLIAVKSYGCLAAPCRYYGKHGDIKKMFSSILAKSFSVFLVENGIRTLEKMYQLSVLVETLSLICLQLKQEELMQNNDHLCLLCMDCVKLLSKQSIYRPLLSSIFKLMLALHRILHESSFKNRFLFNLLYQMVFHAIKSTPNDESKGLSDDDDNEQSKLCFKMIEYLVFFSNRYHARADKLGFTSIEIKNVSVSIVEQISNVVGRLLDEMNSEKEADVFTVDEITNLSILCRLVFTKAEHNTDWIYRLIENITTHLESAHHTSPLLSITSTLFEIVDWEHESFLSSNMLQNLISKCLHLSVDEDLIAVCLECIMAIPFPILTKLADIDKIGVALRNVLLDLGIFAADESEKLLRHLASWINQYPNDNQIITILHRIAPALNAFAYTTSSDFTAVDLIRKTVDIQRISRFRGNKKKLVLQSYITSAENVFSSDQYKRIRDIVFDIVAMMPGKCDADVEESLEFHCCISSTVAVSFIFCSMMSNYRKLMKT